MFKKGVRLARYRTWLAQPLAAFMRRPRPRRDMAVVLHLFYRDLWPELDAHLRNIDIPFDLYVSIPNDRHYRSTKRGVHDAYPDAFIRKTQNRGRDIAPFIALLSSGVLLQYRYVCKIHTKKSLHVHGGDRWRQTILEEVLGSVEQVQSIRRDLDSDPLVGIAGPASSYLERDPFRQSNSGHIDRLCRALGIDLDDHNPGFFAGSMFWFRPAALVRLSELNIATKAFEPELGQVDGTLAHAIERIFTLVVSAAGFKIHLLERNDQAIRL